MHFRKLISSDHLSADDFTDAEMNPIERSLTIKSVSMMKPPAGGKEKACFFFDETPKGAFFANGEIKKLARTLRCAETEGWTGAKIVVTSAEKKMKGQPTTGMVIVRAERKNAT